MLVAGEVAGYVDYLFIATSGGVEASAWLLGLGLDLLVQRIDGLQVATGARPRHILAICVSRRWLDRH